MAEIIKQVPKFRILDRTSELRRQLLKIERAGRTSYQSEKNPITLETAALFAKRMIRSGHESVLEHTSASVKYPDGSIGFTREGNRHRLLSITEESTRYVDNSNFRFVFPKHKDVNQRVDLVGTGREITPGEMVEEIELYYRSLRAAGWAPEEARSFLPLGLNSEIVYSANWREWRHIFELRTAKPAHFEIRSIMVAQLLEFQKRIPGVFDDFVKAGEDKNGYPFYEKVKA